MYVCICNAVTEKMIRTAADSGATNLEDLHRMTGCAGGCGSCADLAEEILAAALRSRRSKPFALSFAHAA